MLIARATALALHRQRKVASLPQCLVEALSVRWHLAFLLIGSVASAPSRLEPSSGASAVSSSAPAIPSASWSSVVSSTASVSVSARRKCKLYGARPQLRSLTLLRPVYVSELAQPSKRGRVVGAQQWAITWGVCVSVPGFIIILMFRQIMIMFYISYGCSYLDGAKAWRVPWGLQVSEPMSNWLESSLEDPGSSRSGSHGATLLPPLYTQHMLLSFPALSNREDVLRSLFLHPRFVTIEANPDLPIDDSRGWIVLWLVRPS